MKKIFYILSVSLCFLPSFLNASVYLDSAFYFRPSEKSAVLRFDIWRIEEGGRRAKYNEIAYINIFDSLTGDPVQKIDETNIIPDEPIPIINFEFDDYNFDGYNDLYLKDACAILGNCNGIIFLYNGNNKIFEYSSQYTGLTTITADKEKKLIYSVNRSGAGAFYALETFRPENGKLILTEVEMQSPMENGKFHYTLERLNSKGEMEVITDEIYDEPRFPFMDE